MRHIKHQLNSSLKTPSWKKQTDLLRSRLETAIYYYSALEQTPRSPDEKTAKAMKKSSDRMSREINDVVADIATALSVRIMII